MRFYFIIGLILLSLADVSAQSPYGNKIKELKSPKVIGYGNFDIVYEQTTKDKRFELPKQFFYILQIDDTVSVYRNYSRFRLDSIIIENPKITEKEYSNEYRIMGVNSDFIKKQYNNRNIVVFDYTSRLDDYIYEEPFSNFEWEVTDSVMQIAGYDCHQAKTRFRGRDWTVWYTEDIPIQDGPWKFQGLPGLILRAYDSTGDQYLTAIIIRKGTGYPIYWEQYMYSKTTRERFLKDKREFMDAPWKFFRGFPGPDGKIQEVPKRIRFYNPMELE